MVPDVFHLSFFPSKPSFWEDKYKWYISLWLSVYFQRCPLFHCEHCLSDGRPALWKVLQKIALGGYFSLLGCDSAM